MVITAKKDLNNMLMYINHEKHEYIHGGSGNAHNNAGNVYGE